MMELQLAVALSCTATGCQVQLVDYDAQVNADYAAPMVDNQITVEPGFWSRWTAMLTRHGSFSAGHPSKRSRTAGGFILTEEGNPVDPVRLRAGFFPGIRAMYQRLETIGALDPKRVVREGYDHITEEHLE
jgi:hypothetical protein